MQTPGKPTPPEVLDHTHTVKWLARILNLSYDTCDQLLEEQPRRNDRETLEARDARRDPLEAFNARRDQYDLLKHLNRPFPFESTKSTKVFRAIYRYHLARTHLLRALSLIIKHSRSWPLPRSRSETPMYRVAKFLFAGDEGEEGLIRRVNEDDTFFPPFFQHKPHVIFCQLMMAELGSGSHVLDHSNQQSMGLRCVQSRLIKGGDAVKFKQRPQLTGKVEEDDKSGRPFKVKWTGNTSGPAEWVEPDKLEPNPRNHTRLPHRVKWTEGSIEGEILKGGKKKELVHVKWEHQAPPEWCTPDELVKTNDTNEPGSGSAPEECCAATLLKYGRISVNAEHEMARLLEYNEKVLSGGGHLQKVKTVFSGGAGEDRPAAFFAEVKCLRAVLEEQEQAAADCIANLVYRDIPNYRPPPEADGADGAAAAEEEELPELPHVLSFDNERMLEEAAGVGAGVVGAGMGAGVLGAGAGAGVLGAGIGAGGVGAVVGAGVVGADVGGDGVYNPRQIEFLLGSPDRLGLISTLNIILVNRAKHGSVKHAVLPTQGRLAATLVAAFIELLAQGHEMYGLLPEKEVRWISLLQKCKSAAHGDDCGDEQAAMDLLAFVVDLVVSTKDGLGDYSYDRCKGWFTERGRGQNREKGQKSDRHLFACPPDDAEITPFEYLEKLTKAPLFLHGLADPLGNYHTFRDRPCSMARLYRRPFAELFGLFYGPGYGATGRTPLYEVFRELTFRDNKPKESRRAPEMDIRQPWPSWYFSMLKAAGSFFSTCKHTEFFHYLFESIYDVFIELDGRFDDPDKSQRLYYRMNSECVAIVVGAFAGFAQCGVEHLYHDGKSKTQLQTSAAVIRVMFFEHDRPQPKYLNWTTMVNNQLYPHVGEFFRSRDDPNTHGILVSPSERYYDEAVSGLSSLLNLMAGVLDDFADFKPVTDVALFFKTFHLKKLESYKPVKEQTNRYPIVDALIVLAFQPLDLHLMAKVLQVLNGLAKGHNDIAVQVAQEFLIPRFEPQQEDPARQQGTRSADYAHARLVLRDEATNIQSYPVTIATLELLVTAFVWTRKHEVDGTPYQEAREWVFPRDMDDDFALKMVESICFYLEESLLRASSDVAARMYADDQDERWKLCKTVLSVYHAFIVELPMTGASVPDKLAERIHNFMISRLVGGPGVNRQRSTIAQPHTSMCLLGDIIQRGYAEHSFGLALAPLDLTICVNYALNIFNAVNDKQQPFLDAAGVDGRSVGEMLISREDSSHVRHLLGFLRFGYSTQIAWMSTLLLRSLIKSHPNEMLIVIQSDFTKTKQANEYSSNFNPMAIGGSVEIGTGTAVGDGFRREILSSLTSHISTSRRRSDVYDVGLSIVQLILDCLKGQRGEFGLGHLLIGFDPSHGALQCLVRRSAPAVEEAVEYAPQRTMLQALDWEGRPIDGNLRPDRMLAEACQHVFFLMCKQGPSRKRASRRMLENLFAPETEATRFQPLGIYNLDDPPDNRPAQISAMVQLGHCLQTIELFIYNEAQVVDRDFPQEIFDKIRHYLALLSVPYEVERDDPNAMSDSLDDDGVQAPMGGDPSNHVLYSKNQSDSMPFGIRENQPEVLEIANEALANADTSEGYLHYNIDAVMKDLNFRLATATQRRSKPEELQHRGGGGGNGTRGDLKLDGSAQRLFVKYLSVFNREKKADFDKQTFFAGWCHTLLLSIYKITDRDLYNSDRITDTVCKIRDLLVRLSRLSANAPGPQYKAVAGQHRQLAETVSYVAAELSKGVVEWRKRGAWKDRGDVVRSLAWKEFAPAFEKVFLGILLTDSWWGGDRQSEGQDPDAAVLTRTLHYNSLLHMIQISKNAEMLDLVSHVDTGDGAPDGDTSFAGVEDVRFQAMNLAVYTMENAMFILWRHLQYYLTVQPGVPGIRPRGVGPGAANGASSTNAIERQPRRLDAAGAASSGSGGQVGGSRRQPPSLDDIDRRRESYDAKILNDFRRRAGGLASDLERLINDAESDQGALAVIEGYFHRAASVPRADHHNGSFVAEKSTEQLMRVVCYDALAQHTKGSRALRVLASMIQLETQGRVDATSKWIGYMSQHNTLRLLVDVILKSDDSICAALRTGANLNYVMNLHEARMDVLLRVASTTEGADQLARVDAMRLLAMMKFIRDPRRKQIRAGEPVALQDHAFQMIVQPVIKLLVSVLQSTKRVPGANRQEVVRQVLGFMLASDNMAYFEKVLQITETRCLTELDLKEIGLVVSLLHQLTEADASRLATQILGREFTKLIKDGVLGLCIWLGDYNPLTGWKRSSQILVDDGWDEWATLNDPIFSAEGPECVNVRRLLLPLMADTIGCVRAVMLPGSAGGSGLPTLNNCRVLFEPEFGFGVQSDRPNLLDHVVGILRHTEHLLHEEKEQFKAPDGVAVSRPANFAGRASFRSFVAEAAGLPKGQIPRAFIGDLWTMVKTLIT